MFVDTFVKLRVRGITLASLAKDYSRWILGENDRARTRRIEEGVRPHWTEEALLASEPLVGDHGCRVDVRLADESLLVRFVHRDNRDVAVFWHSVARAVDAKGEITIEHAAGRDAPRGMPLEPYAAAPRIITSLLDRDGTSVLPRQLNLPLVKLVGDDDVRGFVEHELLNLDREVPVLVVSCGPGGGPPVVDVERLTRRLRGIVPVAFLATARSTFAFAEILDTRGFGREFKCFHGAAHIYGRTRDMNADHRLWLADSLVDLGSSERTERLAGLISGRLGLRTVPSGFFTLVEEHDREAKRMFAVKLAKRASSPPPPHPSHENFLELVADRERFRAELQGALQREKDYLDAWATAEDGRRAAETARDDAEARLEQERALSVDLREKIDVAKSRRPSLDAGTVSAMTDLLVGQHSPEAALRVLAAAFPERVVVLKSAFSSAKQAEGFKHSTRLGELLYRLATDYYDTLADGRGDVAGKTTFGEAFSASESETTMGNPRAKAERTFRHGNEDLVMWRHLRIGVKDSVAETIRVHFDWVAKDKKVVIGWCGEHRHVVG